MSKQFNYQYEDDGKNRIKIEYDSEAGERMQTSVEDGVPYLYLNRAAMITLAKILVKIANGNYTDGFHIHLYKDFNADEVESLVVLLSSPEVKVAPWRPDGRKK
jgi:pyruvate formate-lyase activating enzyme-like uncharacterized protein